MRETCYFSPGGLKALLSYSQIHKQVSGQVHQRKMKIIFFVTMPKRIEFNLSQHTCDIALAWYRHAHAVICVAQIRPEVIHSRFKRKIALEPAIFNRVLHSLVFVFYPPREIHLAGIRVRRAYQYLSSTGFRLRDPALGFD